MPVIDLRNLDTTPGGQGVLAPPASFNGDHPAYLDWLRQQYQWDAGFAQQVAMIRRLHKESLVTVAGPYQQVIHSVLAGRSALDLVETQPGAATVMAPPAQWEGGEEQYLGLLRQRYLDPGTQPWFVRTARGVQAGRLKLVGPWAHPARHAATAVAQR